jgi:hypothetical protein
VKKKKKKNALIRTLKIRHVFLCLIYSVVQEKVIVEFEFFFMCYLLGTGLLQAVRSSLSVLVSAMMFCEGTLNTMFSHLVFASLFHILVSHFLLFLFHLLFHHLLVSHIVFTSLFLHLSFNTLFHDLVSHLFFSFLLSHHVYILFHIFFSYLCFTTSFHILFSHLVTSFTSLSFSSLFVTLYHIHLL